MINSAMEKNNIKFIAILLLFILAILVGVGKWIINKPDSFIYDLDVLKVKSNGRNISIKLYQEWPMMRNIWFVYYKVIEDGEVVCPCNILSLGSINWDKSSFDYVIMGDIIYIRNLNDCQINGIYNIKTRKCEITYPNDTTYLKYPIIDSLNQMSACR